MRVAKTTTWQRAINLLNHPPTPDAAVYKPSPSGTTDPWVLGLYKPATSLIHTSWYFKQDQFRTGKGEQHFFTLTRQSAIQACASTGLLIPDLCGIKFSFLPFARNWGVNAGAQQVVKWRC